ncbi:BapA/Bap/LapF family large adhesin [Pigmentiphaga sp. NML080357]|uniref:BapA/Bap/LapF family large adhesin n=1 Tax=Pigmentiphaga sp. NML080357 TaxID=2008675 RepID=UPI001E357F24|nr:BapA/Bap/LapF family large adhesin [Pigmentiphaga sp. NML080357]
MSETHEFEIAEGTLGNLEFSVDAGSLLSLLSTSYITLQVLQNGEWVNVADTENGKLIDLIGLNGDNLVVEAKDLPAGEYRVVYGGTGVLSVVQAVEWSMNLERTSLTEFDVTKADPVTGNVITDPSFGEGAPDDLGPDDAAVLQVKNADGVFVTPDAAGTVIVGLYGTLTIKPDGSYSYQANTENAAANVGKVDVFDYKLVHPTAGEDSGKLYVRLDSDQVDLVWDDQNPGEDATVVPAVEATADAEVIVETEVEHVPESEVIDYSWLLGALGIVLGETSGSHVFTVEEGTTSTVNLDITGSGLASLLNGLEFTLEVRDANGNWVEVEGSEGGGLIDLIGIFPTQITARIEDLGPGEYRLNVSNASLVSLPGNVSVVMSQDVTHFGHEVAAGVDPAEGNVLEAAGIDVTVDGPVAVSVDASGEVRYPGVDPVVLEGTYGTLTMHADGSWTYEPKAELDSIGQSDVFTYQLHYANGQVSEGTLTVNIGEIDNTLPPPEDAAAGDGDADAAEAFAVPLDGLDQDDDSDDADDVPDDQNDEQEIALEDVLQPEPDPIEAYFAEEDEDDSLLPAPSPEAETTVLAAVYTEDPEDQAWSQHDVSGI